MCQTMISPDDTCVGECDQCSETKTLEIVHSCASVWCCGIGLCAECAIALNAA